MTESEIKAYIASEVAAQLQAITSKDIASESDVPTLSDAEWDTNNSITSLPVVYNGSAWRKIGAGFLRTLRNAAAVVSTAWNALKNNGTSVSWIPTVDTSGNAGKSSPADLASVLGVKVSLKNQSTGTIDLNDVPEGFVIWYCQATTTDRLNYPYDQWGTLVSFKIGSSGTPISPYGMGFQIFLPVLTDLMFYRTYYNSGGWRSWKELQKVG